MKAVKSKNESSPISILEFFMDDEIKKEVSDDIKSLYRFYGFSTVRMTKEAFLSLCEYENIDQYIVVNHRSGVRLYYTDIPYNYPIFEDFTSYIQYSSVDTADFTMFIKTIYEAMNDQNIEEAADLTYRSFYECVKYYSSYNNLKLYSYIFAFYQFCYSKYEINFFEDANLDMKILSKPGLARYLAEGYTIEKYDFSKNIPNSDKWLLCYQKEYESTTEHSHSETLVMKFTQVTNNTFKNWIKHYVWNYSKGLKGKRKDAAVLSKILNYVDEIRHGKISLLYTKKRITLQGPITIEEAIAVRTLIMNKECSEMTKHDHIYIFRAFLKFLHETEYCKVEAGVFFNLYMQAHITNDAMVIPDDDLNKLAKLMKENTSKGIMYELYYVMFYIALETELRITQIVSLKADCVQESIGKKKEYVIKSKKKDESYEESEQAITLYVKRHIDYVLDLTKDLRKISDKNMAENLFIVPQKGFSPVRMLTRENFRRYLLDCCQKLGIPKYTAANLRDTHMTKAREMKIRGEMSELEHKVLTGHKTPNIDMQHYVDMDIHTVMEAIHGVIIGNIDINGRIFEELPEEMDLKRDEVSNGCGYCSNTSCNNISYVDCMLCKYFVTTPSRISFFKDQINIIDQKIKNAKFEHDKEDLTNIKRLLVGYTVAIKEFEMQKEGE